MVGLISQRSGNVRLHHEALGPALSIEAPMSWQADGLTTPFRTPEQV